MSGGVDIRPFPNNWEIKNRIGTIQQYPEQWDELTVINVAKQLKDGDLALSMDCSDGDTFLAVNRALHQQLLQDGITHDYSERPGVHNWVFWRESIKVVMPFIAGKFKAAENTSETSVEYWFLY